MFLVTSCSPVSKRSSFFKYESFISKKQPRPGSPIPDITSDPPAVLLKKGFVPLGYFEVKYITDGNITPDSKEEALSLAGEYGANIVVFSSENELRDDVITKRGKCIETRPYGEVSWESSGGAFGTLSGTSECRRWEDTIEKTRVIVSRGTAWKLAPDLVPKATLTVFFNAINDRDRETIRALIENGLVDVNARDTFGWTPLMLVAFDDHPGNIDEASFLVKKGAIVNLRNNEGMTALMLSVSRGNIAMSRFLLKHNADVTIKDNDGKTALDLAPASLRKEFSALIRGRQNK